MGNKPIRLVAMDVDGTLVDDEKNVPEVNLKALRAARDQGVHVAIASGRMVPSIETLEGRIDFDCALIAYNGGKVVGPRSEGRPCLLHRPLSVEVSTMVIEFARENGHLLNFYFEDKLYADRSQEKSEFAAIYHGRTGSVYHFVELEEFIDRQPTKLILLGEPSRLEELRGEFRERLADQANVLITDPEYLEFMNPGVDKSTALPALAEFFGISTDEVLAIGDADNDRGMVEAAGIGVGVANSRDSVLEVADHVTERTNNDGAVAEAMEKWVLREPIDLWS